MTTGSDTAIAIGDVRVTFGAAVAEGGMATVHRGTTDAGDAVAVKRLRAELAKQREFVSMFQAEAVLSAQLNHPNIVRTIGSAVVDNVPYLVLEWLDGPTVLDVIERGGAMDSACALLVGWQIASALDYAHTRPGDRLVHRDVSPSNIIIDRSGTAKLLDFGIAKASARLSARTRTGLLKGKDGYMSPEQCMGEPVDGRSDVFSLAVVLYEMVTGKRLFRRDHLESSFTVMERVTGGRVPAAPLEHVGVALRAAIGDALEARAADRTESAAALAEQLRETLARDHAIEPAASSPLLAAVADAHG